MNAVYFVVCCILITSISIQYVELMCATSYGEEPCSFVPALPGHTPPCAQSGETFCEKVEYYPMQQIRYLIEKWGYDYNTLLNDETRDEYSTYFVKPDYHGYSNNNGDGYNYPEPIHIPKPPPGSAPYPASSNRYIPPSVPERTNFTEVFAGYPDRRQPIKYSYNNAPPGNHLVNYSRRGQSVHYRHIMPAPGYYSVHYNNQRNEYSDPNSWWRHPRDNRNFLPRSKRSSIKVTDTIKNITNTTRNKRQAALGGPQQLCPTRPQYIMPRAALNNKGNWMYVVNFQEQNNKYTQLVRSETCISQQCSGLCSVPTGYTARCEQRYVQKRLVALEGAGQNLYTDVFWFPSCCVCTFTNN